MNQRTCELDGCDKPHRARGLCSTHYNQTRYLKDQRHPKTDVSCTVCGETVRRSKTETRYLPTCSVACRNAIAFGPVSGDTYSWASDARSRAQKHGALVVETYDRAEVFERDDWRCQSCDIACTEPDPFVLTSATVDHVVPYSRGGEHSLANAQTLCLSCNSAKQDRAA